MRMLLVFKFDILTLIFPPHTYIDDHSLHVIFAKELVGLGVACSVHNWQVPGSSSDDG